MGTGKNIIKKKKIMIVDDEPVSVTLLSLCLKKQGYEITSLTSGSQALQKVQSVSPDLIMLDIKMPGMNGYEVCRELKENGRTSDIPVLFISALDEVLDKVKAFTVGGVDYITKPFEFEEVLARVASHLTIRNLQQELLKQNVQLQEEICIRVKVEEELRQLNIDLDRRVRERTLQLGVEREKSEKLLLNILPEPIVERLKLSDETITESFPNVSVLFADIVQYTKMSSTLSSYEMVNLLNNVFTAFDQLAEKHGLEKIKTIGDAYLVVGGLLMEIENHNYAIAEMALDMLAEVQRISKEMNMNIQIRIGINSGPVTAGVIGKKKFIYDLWGDTVNTASRMESYDLPGEIQVTENTFLHLKNKYRFKERGVIDVKGKGKMKTYFLTGRVND